MWWIEKGNSASEPGAVRASAEWTDSEHAGPAAVTAAATTGVTAAQSLHTRLLTPTTRLTAHQLFYILVLNGVGAVILSGGINFAVAYAMYANLQPPHPPPLLFTLPSSFLGDAAVTAIIQSCVSWLVPLFFVNYDLAHRRVAPLGIFPEPASHLVRRLFFLDHYNGGSGLGHGGKSGSSSPSIPPSSSGCGPGCVPSVGFFLAQLGRAMAVAVMSFCVLIGPTVGILMAVGTRYGGDWVFLDKWTGPLFKLVYGGVLSLLTSPGIAMFWMVRAGWVAKDAGVGET
ncbi:hypothetical protein MMYC01_207608 [Madurella mycetomatis]|uniref:Uncharacterized protein n=1 Tax=Madurella mycetomatis TaxID=100816 RepID=A0A175W1T8_9PEZI|nr:hypothetical protein MMYC01_207608 [Madurella mycetomatis]